MSSNVVNVRTHRCDVYCGRSCNELNRNSHFGNPFSHLKTAKTTIITVSDRDEAIACFEAWIFEESFLDVEPERRKWIQDNVASLKGKVLGCYCAPLSCHCDILERIANES